MVYSVMEFLGFFNLIILVLKSFHKLSKCVADLARRRVFHGLVHAPGQFIEFPIRREEKHLFRDLHQRKQHSAPASLFDAAEVDVANREIVFCRFLAAYFLQSAVFGESDGYFVGLHVNKEFAFHLSTCTLKRLCRPLTCAQARFNATEPVLSVRHGALIPCRDYLCL